MKTLVVWLATVACLGVGLPAFAGQATPDGGAKATSAEGKSGGTRAHSKSGTAARRHRKTGKRTGTKTQKSRKQARSSKPKPDSNK